MEYGNNLNDGRKVEVGVDIINAISKATGVTTPFWLDASGELTEELHTDSQYIRLYASGMDKHLRVERLKQSKEEN